MYRMTAGTCRPKGNFLTFLVVPLSLYVFFFFFTASEISASAVSFFIGPATSTYALTLITIKTKQS